MQTHGPVRLFFTGKGGAGKSTTAALTALHYASLGQKTVLISMDPAHNQGDIFMQRLGEKSTQVAPNLWVQEVDEQRWMKRYLDEAEQEISRRYNYHRAFALNNYFKVLQHSPGMEEYALSLAFGHSLKTFWKHDILIFDMPPTALSLRFFALPSLSLVWLEELYKLRREIYHKQEIISKVKWGHKEVETDNILQKLTTMREKQEHMQSVFTSEKSRIQLVMNQDSLSMSEAVRIRDKLKELKKTVHRLIVNKAKQGQAAPELQQNFPESAIQLLPESNYPLTGLQNLRQFLQELPEFLS